MPFESKAQERWMFATHPQMAKEWASKTPSQSSLPQYKNSQPQRSLLASRMR
jgi:hypothetical protein